MTVELSEEATLTQVIVADYEFHSSGMHKFEIWGTDGHHSDEEGWKKFLPEYAEELLVWEDQVYFKEPSSVYVVSKSNAKRLPAGRMLHIALDAEIGKEAAGKEANIPCDIMAKSTIYVPDDMDVDLENATTAPAGKFRIVGGPSLTLMTPRPSPSPSKISSPRAELRTPSVETGGIRKLLWWLPGMQTKPEPGGLFTSDTATLMKPS